MGDFIADLYIPNPVLQKEKDESPLIKRNPVLFWKILALMATGVALVETLMLVSK
ncbi:hypothetical protein JCM19231_4151 [Vibrio ishigakensis]|uniref:Uncharacterized protein n=1 Tax=Vibrio ishigakensis TaxID=1481914 RepID=A0A0B8P7R2_9VIBR|nr:hypothetical protein JCM19231_4151 [Vibrio ishigakensis]GAM74870.1 hypothetical protein JCM19241_1213 [Vibrio ishigakensis]